MKKIININLSGRVIPIEDAAYESLQRYIESLRRYFANEEGRDEIINDIESRIAELMSDKVTKGATAVTETDIEEIITSMGRIEDFEQADTSDSAAAGAGTGAADPFIRIKATKGRMYRDSTDKLLGGVCAGIANYMNIDPAIVRLLFAIITFGGFGFGIFIYIVLWIILPARRLDTFIGKRLFRNPDDRVIGGVAGGLAAYFKKETWIIRLIFAAPLLLNIVLSILNAIFHSFNRGYFPDIFFGSFTGTFILAYIILWIVLPEARSPFEKMEMRGEKVDVNRIRQNVQEGMSDVRSRAETWGEEVRMSAEELGRRASEFANTRGRTFAAEFGQAARPVATGIGHAIGVIFKAFFLFVVGVIAFALFIMVLVFTLGGVARPFNDFMLNGFWQTASLWSTLIFFLAVPMIALITWIVRRLMKVRSQNRYLGWMFGGLWLLGWISLGIFITSMVRDFRYYSKTPTEVAVARPVMDKMVVRVDEPVVQYSGTFDWIESDGKGWDLTEDSLKISTIKLRINRSEDSFYHVTLWKYSAGRNRAEALQRAQMITYSAATYDSILSLGSGYGINKAQKFRAQRILVEIKVPVGRQIRFDNTVEKLDRFDVRVRETGRWGNREWDLDWDDDSYYDWKPDVDYTMTAEGELVNAEQLRDAERMNRELDERLQRRPGQEGVYEYRGNTDSLNQLNEERQRIREQQIQEQRRRVEEENQKLRDLENRRTDEGTTRVRPKPKMDAGSIGMVNAQMVSPVLSLIL